MIKFKISEEINEKCAAFAKASVDSSVDKYASRQQFNTNKISKDIKNGKIGEEGVYEQFVSKFPNLTKPDHNVYSKGDKSWDPDLKDPDSGIRLAVKSQDIESAINFGESWVFQFGNGKSDCDAGVFKESDPNHYVAFVSLNVPKRIGEIKAVVKIQWLHDKKLFKEMQKESLRGNKLAIYMDDLIQFKDELFQL